MLTYALLTPFILPIAATTFGITYLCFHSLLRHVARVEADTRGQLYFRAWFGLFWGLYTQQATMIGLFILKLDVRNAGRRAQDLGQLTVLLLTLFFSVQYHWSLSRLYGPLMRHQEGTTLEPTVAGPPHDPRNSQRSHTSDASHTLDVSHASDASDASDAFDAMSSKEDVVSTEQWLHERPPVIWLPRDSAGISQALVERIQSGPLAGSLNMVQVTDSPVGVTRDDQLQVRNITSKA